MADNEMNAGAAVAPRFCTSCGAPLQEDAVFCTSCGARVERPAGVPSPAAQPLPGGGAVDSTQVMPGVAQPTAQSTMPVPAVSAPAAAASPRATAPSKAPVIVAVAAVIAVAVLAVGMFLITRGPAAPAATTGQDGANASGISASATNDADSSAEDTPADRAPAEEEPTDDAADSDSASEDREPAGAETSNDAYILPDSDARVYSSDELGGFSDYDLYLARNEIFARHGRQFKNEDLHRYFGSKSWYNPSIAPDDFSESMLNDTELANVHMIKSIEEARGSSYL